MPPDVLSFLGGFQRPVSYTTGLLGDLAQKLIQQKLHPVTEMGMNRVQVPKGGATGYYDAMGNFHFGNSSF
jgi:hypothetical protein